MTSNASRPSSRTARWLSVVALASLAACSGRDVGQLTAAGIAHLDKKEYRAAQIEFKNVLQIEPQNVQARFLLGRVLLEAGDSMGALVEFNKLAEAGYDVEQLAPLSARAMLNQGELDKLIATWSDTQLSNPASIAQVKATLAAAYGIKGQLDKAAAAVQQALAADGNNMEARLAHAQVLATGGDAAAALAEVEVAAKAHGDSARPFLVRAKLLQDGRAAPADVALAFNEALKRDPRNAQARLGLIGLHLRAREMDAATAEVAKLREADPNGLPSLYFGTLLALDKRDLKAAREGADQLLKMAPENVAALQLVGSVDYETASYGQAAAHFGKALLRAGESAPLRLMLARALIRSGEMKKAVSTLQPLVGDGPNPEALTLAADAYTALGEPDKAKQLYQRAVALNPKGTQARSALALSDISEGRLDQGLRALQQLAKTTDSAQVDLLLFGANLQARRFDDAAAAIAQLEQRQPDSALAAFLSGQLAVARGEAGQARQAFESALKREPSQLGAVVALGALDVQAGRSDAALARYQSFVERVPRAMEAELAIVAIKSQQGATTDQTRADLDRLVKKYPEAVEPVIAQARLMLDLKDVKAAQQLVRDLVAAFPDSTQALDMAGQVEMAAGDFNQALQTFGKLAAIAPRSATPLLRLAQVQTARRDTAAALTQLRKAVALEPGHRDVQFQLVSLLARAGKADEALQQAQSVQKILPEDPLGWTMEGDLRAGKANYAGAVAAYEKSLSKGKVGATAVKLHRAMEDAGKLKEAQAFEDTWRQANPDDPLFNYYLGDRYLVLNKTDVAERLYRSVLKSQPNDGATLNNLAWILGRKGDAEALKFGERALAVAPNSPDFMDTVAELHANAGRAAQAVTLQRRAVELAPTQPLLRLHLAQYLIKDNQRAAARRELEGLESLGTKFARQDEVKRLLATL